MRKRIGVLGGSFDPVHYGHLILAEQIKTEAELDKVVFVPAYVSPFKMWETHTDGNHRTEMLKLAINGHPGFEISSIELKKNTPSYTYDTLSQLKDYYGNDTDIFFIIGTDAFMHIEEWKHSEELLNGFSFLIGLRKGYDEKKLEAILEDLKTRYPLKADYIRIPELEIASSDLRDRIAAGKSVKFLLPDSVIKYIGEQNLYENICIMIESFVKKRVDPQRYEHTVGVVSMARELAYKYGADPDQAEIAAWFHDAYREAGNLEHGPKAAEKLRELFGIEDAQILNAIRYHTTGRCGMCLLEKIIYLADSLEKGRDYPGVEDLRNISSDNIDEYVYILMVHTRQYVENLGIEFNSRSIEAIQELALRLGKEITNDQ
ncbi:MAG: nicotinate-nucleotide adenylyltransferase [Clostridia bacterium]|nr:nicotinate-nucleotide adenylyltransferase [Clostridia bacterium]